MAPITKLESALVACLPLFAYWVWPIASGRPVKLKALEMHPGTGCGLPSQHASSISVRFAFPEGVPLELARRIEAEALALGYKPVSIGRWVKPQGSWPVRGTQSVAILAEVL